MILAIDLDQTYSIDPDMWDDIIDILESKGHTVICVTCRPYWDENDTACKRIKQKLGSDKFYATDNEDKITYMEGRSHVDIWIDDTPATITGGGKVMYRGIYQNRFKKDEKK